MAKFLVRCFQVSAPTWGHVNHHRLQNSLIIDFIGIHALKHLFSIKFYEKLDQYEISRSILNIWLLIGSSSLCVALCEWMRCVKWRLRHSVMNAGYPSLGITRRHDRVGRLFLSHFLQKFVVHRGNDNLTFIETYIEIYMQVRMLCPLATTTIRPFVCIIDLNLIVKYNSLSLVWPSVCALLNLVALSHK